MNDASNHRFSVPFIFLSSDWEREMHQSSCRSTIADSSWSRSSSSDRSRETMKRSSKQVWRREPRLPLVALGSSGPAFGCRRLHASTATATETLATKKVHRTSCCRAPVTHSLRQSLSERDAGKGPRLSLPFTHSAALTCRQLVCGTRGRETLSAIHLLPHTYMQTPADISRQGSSQKG